MFSYFAVDEAALAEFSCDDDRHQDLLELWAELGVLVFDGDKWNESLFFQTISGLPVQTRKLWMQHYRLYKSRTLSSRLLADLVASNYECFPSKLSQDINVMFCGANLSSQHIGRATKKARCVDDVEFVRFESCRRSEIWEEKRSLRGAEIPSGTSTQDIWLERMQPLAELSTAVRVVDSYAIKNCLEYRGSTGKAGLRSLFSNLSALGKSFDLEIYAAKWSWKAGEIEDLMHAYIKEIGAHWLNNMELYLVDEAVFRSYRHSRYIRFDRFVCETDKGIAVLDGTELRVPSTYSLKNLQKTHRNTEEQFRYKGEQVVICS